MGAGGRGPKWQTGRMRRGLPGGFELDDDPGRIDADVVYRYLSGESYWAAGRTREAVERALEGSAHVVGLYRAGEQIGFARVVSDGVAMAYLADVFVLPEWQGRGLGSKLLALLCDRFDRPAVVAGFSMGATIAALATARRPDLVAALVAVGMDIDGPAAEDGAYQFALATAHARNNRRALRQLEAIGPPPHLEPRQFATRARWAANFGGVRTGHTYNSMARSLLVSLLRSPDYSLADTVRALRGITAAQAALVPELAALDLTRTLPRLDTPIVMAQGRHDQVAPPSAAERYAGLLEAPHKQLVWFEDSAHMPHLEEPERFRQLLAQVRSGLPAKT